MTTTNIISSTISTTTPATTIPMMAARGNDLSRFDAIDAVNAVVDGVDVDTYGGDVGSNV